MSNTNNSFNIDKNSRIVIYGAGPFGQRVCHGLKDEGFQVELIIDKSASEGDFFEGTPVYDAERAKSEITDVADIVAIICLQNGTIHPQVAAMINRDLGITNILFLPMEIEQSIEERFRYRRSFMDILQGRYGDLKDIPCYSITDNSPFAVISETEEYVSFWCPVAIINIPPIGIEYTDCYIDKEISEELRDYFDTNITNHKPYYQLFDWYEGKIATPDLYLKDRRMYDLNLDTDKYLQHRRELLDIFNEAYKYDPDFFIYSPGESVLCEDGKEIYILDGTHRACFLVYKGYKEVPVLLNRADYDKLVKNTTK